MNYIYVPKEKVAYFKGLFASLLDDVRVIVKPKFTFTYHYVGSSAHNMVTMIEGGNQGFDLDCNLMLNSNAAKYSYENIKHTLMSAFDQASKNNHQVFEYSEDSTRVITIKILDSKRNHIVFSCDIGILVKDPNGDNNDVIIYDKDYQRYILNRLPDSDQQLLKREAWCKNYKYWNSVREEYLYLKNNDTAGKKSLSLYKEAVNNIYNQKKNQQR